MDQDQGTNCLQRLSANDKINAAASKESVKDSIAVIECIIFHTIRPPHAHPCQDVELLTWKSSNLEKKCLDISSQQCDNVLTYAIRCFCHKLKVTLLG